MLFQSLMVFSSELFSGSESAKPVGKKIIEIYNAHGVGACRSSHFDPPENMIKILRNRNPGVQITVEDVGNERIILLHESCDWRFGIRGHAQWFHGVGYIVGYKDGEYCDTKLWCGDIAFQAV